MLNDIWLIKVLADSIWDRFAQLEYLQMFAIGLGVAALLLLIVYFVITVQLRRSKLKKHSIYINLDGGIYQGSDEEMIFKAKTDSEVDISHIAPFKEGYKFNGFNVYKRYISSRITNKGIEKTTITTEELDGETKDFILMPDYDLYLIAKYSPLSDRKIDELATLPYYSDFLNFEDLVSEIMHLNDDKKNYPEPIVIKTSAKHKNALFIFKRDTIICMLYRINGLTKVFLRTMDDLEEKMLNSFYQAEDINDSYNWYSFVIIYNTKLSRFIRSFKNTYDAIDAEDATSQVEFNLICDSITNFSDPIVDRAQFLVNLYEEKKREKNPPTFVSKRELPSDFNINLVRKKEDKKDDAILHKPIKEFEVVGKVDSFVEKTADKSEKPIDLVEINKDDKKVISPSKEKTEEFKKDNQTADKNKTDKSLVSDSAKNVDTIGKKVPLTKLEKQELSIVPSSLKLNREQFVDLVTSSFPKDDRQVEKSEIAKFPITLKSNGKVYALVYENSFGLVRVVIRTEREVFEKNFANHLSFTKARFPIGKYWYQFYLDKSFDSKEELMKIIKLVKDNVNKY